MNRHATAPSWSTSNRSSSSRMLARLLLPPRPRLGVLPLQRGSRPRVAQGPALPPEHRGLRLALPLLPRSRLGVLPYCGVAAQGGAGTCPPSRTPVAATCTYSSAPAPPGCAPLAAGVTASGELADRLSLQCADGHAYRFYLVAAAARAATAEQAAGAAGAQAGAAAAAGAAEAGAAAGTAGAAEASPAAAGAVA